MELQQDTSEGVEWDGGQHPRALQPANVAETMGSRFTQIPSQETRSGEIRTVSVSVYYMFTLMITLHTHTPKAGSYELMSIGYSLN